MKSAVNGLILRSLQEMRAPRRPWRNQAGQFCKREKSQTSQWSESSSLAICKHGRCMGCDRRHYGQRSLAPMTPRKGP